MRGTKDIVILLVSRSSFCVRYRFYLSLSYNSFYLRKSLSQLVYVLSQLVSYFVLSQKPFISACLCFISTCLNALSHTFISHHSFISLFYLTPYFYLTLKTISQKSLSQKTLISEVFISENLDLSQKNQILLSQNLYLSLSGSLVIFCLTL